MKNNADFMSIIDWDYTLNHNTKNFINRKKKKDTKVFIQNILNFFKNESSHKSSYRKNNNKTPRTLYSKIYYFVLLILFIGFLSFFTVILSSSYSVKDYEVNNNNIYDNHNSGEILMDYLSLNDTGHENMRENTSDTTLNLTTQTIEYNTYRVQKNDTYEKIAQKFDLNVDSILLVNYITRNKVLKAGATLEIPNQNGRLIKVRNNDSIFKIANRYGVKWEKIVDSNKLESSMIYPGQKLFIPGSKMTKYEWNVFYKIDFIWPVRGRLTSRFGARIDPFTGTYGFHSGIDIKKTKGAKIKAAKDGKVVYVGWQKVYGNFVMIKHKDKTMSIYAHLSKYDVKKNMWVKQGDYIGRVGSTGRSTGPHLHFEIRKNDKLMNPLDFLN